MGDGAGAPGREGARSAAVARGDAPVCSDSPAPPSPRSRWRQRDGEGGQGGGARSPPLQVRNRRPSCGRRRRRRRPRRPRREPVARLGGHWEGWRTARPNICVARNDDNACAWDVEKRRPRPRVPTSTSATRARSRRAEQGRFLHTRQYPHTWQDPSPARSTSRTGRCGSERAVHGSRRRRARRGRPLGRHHPSIVDAVEPRWVTRYELSAAPRVAGGCRSASLTATRMRRRRSATL